MPAMSLNQYIKRHMRNVPGFLHSLDAELIRILLQHQNGTAGNLCEIGVHHGRLFLMLCLARQKEERSLAIDLFEDDSANAKTKHAGRNTAMLENARRLEIELSDDEVFKTSSLEIQPADIIARTKGPIRFFSVDGGHLYKHVANDLRLAQQTLHPEGVIAVDDFFNIGWADVSFATYDFLKSSDEVVPFAVTSSKLYLAPPAPANMYKKALLEGMSGYRSSSAHILGHEVAVFRQNALSRIIDRSRDCVERLIK